MIEAVTCPLSLGSGGFLPVKKFRCISAGKQCTNLQLNEGRAMAAFDPELKREMRSLVGASDLYAIGDGYA
jgi:hypothetical protein